MHVPRKYIPSELINVVFGPGAVVTDHVWAHGVRGLIEFMKVQGTYSLALSHDMKLSVQSDNRTLLGYEAVDHWKGKHIKLMEVKRVMTGSFRVYNAVMEYLTCRPKESQEFESGSHKYRVEVDGAVYRDGEKIIQILDANPITAVLRLAGTGAEDYSFVTEVPVKVLEGEDMHRINLEHLGEMIEQVIASPMFLESKNKTVPFRAVIGIRSWAHYYSKHFGLPALPMTTLELSELSRMALFEGDSTELYRIKLMYRDVYGLTEDQDIYDIGLNQADLNTISASHA
jgi:hypothetical protein